MTGAQLLRAATFAAGLALGIAGGGLVSAVASQTASPIAPQTASTIAAPTPGAGSPVVEAAATGSGFAAPAGTDALLRSDRFRRLAHELRCLVCQNQTLADSNAPLAIDLRNEVLRLMAAGNSDREIKQHLVDRYGQFVLYRPTLSAQNLALWIGPFVLLAIGIVVIWRLGRRGRRDRGAGRAVAASGGDELERIDRMLSDR